MISVWWTLVVFIGGGCAGVLLMALMRFSGDLPEHRLVHERGTDHGFSPNKIVAAPIPQPSVKLLSEQ